MSDGMGNFRGSSSGSSPTWLLRQQKRAIKQAGKKLQEIDKKYSTKILKDDIQAETLLADLGATKTIIGTTIGGIVIVDNKIVLIKHKLAGRGFPKGGLESGESQEKCLQRELYEEVGLSPDDYIIVKKLDEYEGYSEIHKENKYYIWYLVKVINTKNNLENSELKSKDPLIEKIGLFDIEFILDTIKSKHQKDFWIKNQYQIIS